MPSFSQAASEGEQAQAAIASPQATLVAARLQKIRPAIPPSVRLIAVTKTFPAAVVRSAYAAGIRDFAENKVQEALEKQKDLADLADVTWHFIGHIQSNKARKVVENFDWIHSVDSLKLANRLNRQAGELDKQPNCCLQVKLVPDENKSGFEPATLRNSLEPLDQLSHLRIRGLMVIAPYGLSAQENQRIFERGRLLAAEIGQMGLARIGMDELSMGMSGDFQQAIAAGSTMVRIGSGLFGPR
ncbi:MAG: YggS family pyridoxal phosphate-dependent enzyme [Cyanobacteria bacterium J06607_13]